MLLDSLLFIFLIIALIAIYTINRTYYRCRANKESIIILLDAIYEVLQKRNALINEMFIFLNSIVSNHLDDSFKTLNDEISNLGNIIEKEFVNFDVDKISIQEEEYREKVIQLFINTKKIPNMEHNLDIHDFKKQYTNLNLDLLTFQDRYNSRVKENNNLMTKFPYKYYNKYLEIFKLPFLKFKKLVEM